MKRSFVKASALFVVLAATTAGAAYIYKTDKQIEESDLSLFKMSNDTKAATDNQLKYIAPISTGGENRMEYLVQDSSGAYHVLGRGDAEEDSWIFSGTTSNPANSYWEADINGNGIFGDENITGYRDGIENKVKSWEDNNYSIFRVEENGESVLYINSAASSKWGPIQINAGINRLTADDILNNLVDANGVKQEPMSGYDEQLMDAARYNGDAFFITKDSNDKYNMYYTSSAGIHRGDYVGNSYANQAGSSLLKNAEGLHFYTDGGTLKSGDGKDSVLLRITGGGKENFLYLGPNYTSDAEPTKTNSTFFNPASTAQYYSKWGTIDTSSAPTGYENSAWIGSLDSDMFVDAAVLNGSASILWNDSGTSNISQVGNADLFAGGSNYYGFSEVYTTELTKISEAKGIQRGLDDSYLVQGDDKIIEVTDQFTKDITPDGYKFEGNEYGVFYDQNKSTLKSNGVFFDSSTNTLLGIGQNSTGILSSDKTRFTTPTAIETLAPVFVIPTDESVKFAKPTDNSNEIVITYGLETLDGAAIDQSYLDSIKFVFSNDGEPLILGGTTTYNATSGYYETVIKSSSFVSGANIKLVGYDDGFRQNSINGVISSAKLFEDEYELKFSKELATLSNLQVSSTPENITVTFEEPKNDPELYTILNEDHIKLTITYSDNVPVEYTKASNPGLTVDTTGAKNVWTWVLDEKRPGDTINNVTVSSLNVESTPQYDFNSISISPHVPIEKIEPEYVEDSFTEASRQENSFSVSLQIIQNTSDHKEWNQNNFSLRANIDDATTPESISVIQKGSGERVEATGATQYEFATTNNYPPNTKFSNIEFTIDGGTTWISYASPIYTDAKISSVINNTFEVNEDLITQTSIGAGAWSVDVHSGGEYQTVVKDAALKSEDNTTVIDGYYKKNGSGVKHELDPEDLSITVVDDETISVSLATSLEDLAVGTGFEFHITLDDGENPASDTIIGTVITESKLPVELESLVFSDVSYRTATATIKTKDDTLGIHEDLSVNKVKFYDAEDGTEFIATYLETVNVNEFKYSITNLNPDSTPNGKTYNIEAKYNVGTEDESVSSAELTTLPLEAVEFTAEEPAQTSATSTTVVVNVPLAEGDQYQLVDYPLTGMGVNGEGNIRFFKGTEEITNTVQYRRVGGQNLFTFTDVDKTEMLEKDSTTVESIDITIKLYDLIDDSETASKTIAITPEEKLTPKLESYNEEGVTQNDWTFTTSITSGGEYSSFNVANENIGNYIDPSIFAVALTNSEDKNTISPSVKLLSIDGSAGLETAPSADQETHNYKWTVTGLDAETRYEYEILIAGEVSSVGSIVTEDRFEAEVDTASYKTTGATYESILFTIDIRDSGNYNSFDLNDFAIKMHNSNTNVWETVNSTTITKSATESSREGYSTYKVVASGLNSGVHYDKIQYSIDGGKSYTPAANTDSSATTASKKENEISGNFQILSNDRESASSFEFSIDVFSGEEYKDFDTSSLKIWAVPTSIYDGVKGNKVELESTFVSSKASTVSGANTYTYKVTGLDNNTSYSNFHVSVTNSETDGIDSNAQYRTSKGKSPLVSTTLSVDNNTITDSSFEFEVEIYNSAYDPEYATFTPEDLSLSYRDLNIDILSPWIRLDTQLVDSSMLMSKDSSASVSHYTYKVTGLEKNTTYSNFMIDTSGKGYFTDKVSGQVTTNAVKSPFDPTENEVEFDYGSITKNSFEFTLAVKAESKKADDTYSAFAENETIINSNLRPFKTELINTDESSESTDGLIYYTYKASGLYSGTVYSGLEITINSQYGATENDSKTYLRFIYDIPYATITTNIDPTPYIKGSAVLLIFLILIILIVMIYLLYIFYKRNIAISIYPEPESIRTEQPIYRITNAQRVKELWEAPADELKLYVADQEIEAIFTKDEHVKGSFKIIIPNMHKYPEKIVYLITAAKYGVYDVSWDNGITKQPLLALEDTKIKKVVKSAEKQSQYKAVLDSASKDSETADIISLQEKASKMPFIFFFNKEESTPTTIRYQVIAPERMDILDRMIEDDEDMLLLYEVDGKLYPLKHKFIDVVGSLYSFDLYGLQPGTIYPLVHFSANAGKTVWMSLCLYGITKDDKGKKVSLKDARMPRPSGKAYNLPPLEASLEYAGEEIMNRSLDVAIQKHYQRDTGLWLSDDELEAQRQVYISAWYKEVSKVDIESSKQLAKDLSKGVSYKETSLEEAANKRVGDGPTHSSNSKYIKKQNVVENELQKDLEEEKKEREKTAEKTAERKLRLEKEAKSKAKKESDSKAKK